MAEFSLESKDYLRYGLDDTRCHLWRPTGTIKLIIETSLWLIEGNGLCWEFADAPSVQRLYEGYKLLFSRKELSLAGLMLIVPYHALTNAETQFLAQLAERRHPLNVKGDFYGIAGECCCFSACVPHESAPDLIGYQENPEGCYFIRQPQTEKEIERAIEATLSAFAANLRYSGQDQKIIRIIRAATRNMKLDFCQDDLCDYPTSIS